MSRTKNKKSGVVHARGYISFRTLCGVWIRPTSMVKISEAEGITCKTCLRILKRKEKVSNDAEIACGVCRQMLFKEEAVALAKKSLKEVSPSLWLNLTEEARKAVLLYIKAYPIKDAKTINDVLVEMLARFGRIMKAYGHKL